MKAEDVKNQNLLLQVSTLWLRRLMVSPVPKDDLPPPLLAAMDRIESFCRAVVCLLCPRPQHLGCTVKQVFTISKSDSTHLLEQELRDQLKSDGVWKKKYIDAQKAAGPDKEWASKLPEAEASLKNMSVDDLTAMYATVMEAAIAWDGMNKNLRPGATSELEALLAPKLVTISQKISSSTNPAIMDETGANAEQLVYYLEAFKNYPGVAEQLVAFRAWVGIYESSLSVRKLENYVFEAMAKSPTEIDIPYLAKLSEKVDVWTDEMVASIMPMILAKLNGLLEQAWFGLAGLASVFRIWSIVYGAKDVDLHSAPV